MNLGRPATHRGLVQRDRPYNRNERPSILKTFDVISPDDDRIFIGFNVKLADGSLSLLTLPRFDFMNEDELDAIQESLESVDESLPLHKQQKQTFLIQLKPFCTEQQYEAISKLPLGPLTKLFNDWTEASNMPLGEYLASVESSTESSGKRSKPTSSSKAGDD